jgi:transposase
MKHDIKKTKTILAVSSPLKKINPNVAGIDIGAQSIFICAPISRDKLEIREFLTVTADLKAASAWLKKCKVTSVAMESTGSYWIPSYEILEEAGFELVLANTHHLKIVPGRKTDVKDCQWIQHLHSLGLLSGSFRPKQDAVVLRAYVRQRNKLIQLATVQSQLMSKALIQMNIRLDQVFSDILGASGLATIRSIVAGETDPAKLAENRNYRCKNPKGKVLLALEGNFRQEHIFALKQSLDSYDFIKSQILECDEKIKATVDYWSAEQEKMLNPESNIDFKLEQQLHDTDQQKTQKSRSKNTYHFDVLTPLKKICGVNLTEIPGIEGNTAMKIIGEIGNDMSPWATAKHFVSWMGLCPGNKISGGRILSSKSIPTANRARQALLVAANTLHSSGSALGAYFRRMKTRIGAPKAMVATAHKLAKIIYHMIKKRESFNDIGQEAYAKRHEQRTIANMEKRAAKLGYSLVKVAL